MSQFDFNDAGRQQHGLIPRGTIAEVELQILPGGYNDPALGLTGGWATQNAVTQSVYLKARARVISGEYRNRIISVTVGLRSLKGPEWGQMGDRRGERGDDEHPPSFRSPSGTRSWPSPSSRRGLTARPRASATSSRTAAPAARWGIRNRSF